MLGVDGLKVVMDAMRAHENDSHVQQSGFRVLTCLTTDSQERKSVADQLGCMEWTHRVMGVHQSHGDLLCLASRFVTCMIKRAHHGGEERWVKVAELGTIKVLTEALREHKSDLTVCRGICKALACFSKLQSARHKYLLLTQGACDAVLEVMDTHNQDALIVTCGTSCCEVSLLTCMRPCPQDVLDFTMRARPIIFDIMSKNISSAPMSVACAKLLKGLSITYDPESFRREVNLLMDCLKTHTVTVSAVIICQLCSELACSMAGSRIQKDAYREAGLMEMLLALTERVKDKPCMVWGIRSVFTEMTRKHEENQAYLTRIMSPKQTKLLYKSGFDLQSVVFDEVASADDEFLQEVGWNREAGIQWLADDMQKDAIAQKFHVRAQEKQAEACTACGKTAGELGLERLLRCGACTLRPWYCSAECQRACWGAHKAECKANRVQKS